MTRTPENHTSLRLALSRDDAAAALDISRDHFDRHVLPHIKTAAIGRRVVVSVRELELFLEARSV